MGYPLSEAGQKAFLSGGLQTVSIAVTLASGETMTLTGANIRQGGLTIDRGCVKGEVFTLGTALAAELSLVLDNATGAFDNISFTGAEMNVSVSVTSGGTTYTCPMGIFIIDSETRTRYTVELAGMDYMTKFDRVMALTNYIGTSTTIGNFIQDICTDCGVTLRTASLSGLPNLSAPFTLGQWQTAGDSVAEINRTTYSCRQWLSWAVQMMGCIAYIDWEGQLRVRQYQSTTGFVKLSLGDMFSYNPAKDSFVYDTVALQFRDDTTYAGFLIGGGRSYLGYPIVGNSIAKYSNVWQYAGLVNNIASSLPKGFEDTTTGEWGGYTPFDAETMPIPWVWPGDSFSFYENADDAEPTSVSPTTHMCFAMNGRCTLSCDWTTRNLFDTTLAYSPLGDQTQFSPNQDATIDGKLADYLAPDGNGRVTISGDLQVSGDISGGNGTFSGDISSTGTVSGADLSTSGDLAVDGSVTIGGDALNAFVVETGSETVTADEVWTYRKWSDGRLELEMRNSAYNTAFTVSNAIGNMFNSANVSMTLPSVMTAIDYFSVTLVHSGGYVWSSAWLANSDRTLRFRAISPTSLSAGTLRVYIHAVGAWQ